MACNEEMFDQEAVPELSTRTHKEQITIFQSMHDKEPSTNESRSGSRNTGSDSTISTTSLDVAPGSPENTAADVSPVHLPEIQNKFSSVHYTSSEAANPKPQNTRQSSMGPNVLGKLFNDFPKLHVGTFSPLQERQQSRILSDSHCSSPAIQLKLRKKKLAKTGSYCIRPRWVASQDQIITCEEHLLRGGKHAYERDHLKVDKFLSNRFDYYCHSSYPSDSPSIVRKQLIRQVALDSQRASATLIKKEDVTKRMSSDSDRQSTIQGRLLSPQIDRRLVEASISSSNKFPNELGSSMMSRRNAIAIPRSRHPGIPQDSDQSPSRRSTRHPGGTQVLHQYQNKRSTWYSGGTQESHQYPSIRSTRHQGDTQDPESYPCRKSTGHPGGTQESHQSPSRRSTSHPRKPHQYPHIRFTRHPGSTWDLNQFPSRRYINHDSTGSITRGEPTSPRSRRSMHHPNMDSHNSRQSTQKHQKEVGAGRKPSVLSVGKNLERAMAIQQWPPTVRK